MERKLPELDYNKIKDNNDLKEIIRNNQLELYENEIALLDNINLGFSLNELSEESTSFLFNYTDDSVVIPYTGEKTKNDLLKSYLMTKDYCDELSEQIWEIKIEEKIVKDKVVEIKKVLIKDRTLYQKIKIAAAKYWSKYNLNKYLNDFKVVMEGSVNRVDVLKEAIYNDAINENNDNNYRIANRRLAVDAFGLKENKIEIQFDAFNTGGGSLVKQTLDKLSKPNVDIYDIDDNISLEIEVVDDE